MRERWKKIRVRFALHRRLKRLTRDYLDTRYSVSHVGNVRNDKTNKILCREKNTNGSLVVRLVTPHGIHIKRSVHLLVATAFAPIPREYKKEGLTEDTLLVAFKNGDKTDCHVNNLRWAKWGEVNGRGKGNARSKLNDAQVQQIRQRWSSGETQKSLAAAFKVSQSVISNVVNGKAWSHVG